MRGLNCLNETVQMMGHNICFIAELTKIIPNYLDLWQDRQIEKKPKIASQHFGMITYTTQQQLSVLHICLIILVFIDGCPEIVLKNWP